MMFQRDVYFYFYYLHVQGATYVYAVHSVFIIWIRSVDQTTYSIVTDGKPNMQNEKNIHYNISDYNNNNNVIRPCVRSHGEH